MRASWFVAFPEDHERGAPAPSPAVHRSVVTHRSGRAWIVADTTHAALVTAASGARRLAVFGETDTDPGRLARLLDRHPDATGVMDAAHALPGSFHVLYTDGSSTYVQGTASGVRQVFWCRDDDGHPLVSDTVEVLARLTGARVEPRAAAWGLLHPGLDYGLVTDTFWQGVHRLPADQRLHLSGGRVSRSVWWQPPAAELREAEGAPALRAALDAAVGVRVAGGRRLSADMSGGMDSTSLCYLLSEQGAEYSAFVEQTLDPNHDDARWAGVAAQALGQPLTVFGPDDLPRPYDGIATADGDLDTSVPYEIGEPYTLIRNRTRKIALGKLFAGSGSVAHVAGFGGDELFTVAPSYYSDLYATAPLRAMRAIRPLAHLRRWPLRTVYRALRAQQTYDAWFTTQLGDLEAEPVDLLRVPSVGWGPRLRLPPWATPATAEAIRSLAGDAPRPYRPQAPARAGHTAVAGQRIGGTRLAPLRRLLERSGVALTLPFMDDAVFTTALSFSRAESLPGARYKPILKAAMNLGGAKPGLDRSTKGEFSMSVHRGMSRNRAALLAMLTDSALADLGLVDLPALRAALRDNMRPQRDTAALELTLGLEAWLRAVGGRLTAPSTALTDLEI
ncbi:asparagine synthase-related protein [Actinoplanes sp. NPDC051411]|uniref:asparagine synthase-related protein n=1 Tax=Actinoplanes sp. NPDC051411 TaxID=3155522 RepID=UPI003442DE83